MIWEQQEPKPMSAGQPILLNGSSSLWRVARGAIDLFVIPIREGEPAGAREHLCRISASHFFCGLGASSLEAPVGLLAVALPDTECLEIPDAVQRVTEHDYRSVLLAAFQDWLATLAKVLAPVEKELFLPTPGDLSQADPIALDALLEKHHRILLESMQRQRQAQAEQIAARLEIKRKRDNQVFSRGVSDLASVLAERDEIIQQSGIGGDEPLLLACQMVLEASGIIADLSLSAEKSAEGRQIEDFARQAGVMFRSVELTQDAWWRADVGPLLAFEQESGRPLALLPDPKQGYRVVDPISGTGERLNASTAARLHTDAFMFFRSFPEHELGLRDLLRFGLQGTKGDVVRLLTFGALGGLLGILTPFATGLLVDRIIPSAFTDELLHMVLLLVTAAIGISTFEITRAIAMLLIDSRIGLASQSAIIHRLLHLPAAFFRDYAAGDLAQRAFGISGILQTLSSTTQSAVLSWIFGLFSYVYLFLIDWQLALVATLLVTVSLLFTTAINLWRLAKEREMINLEGKIASQVFQLLGGVAKLRANGGEKSAFALWARNFAQQNRLSFGIGWANSLLTSFNAGYVVINSLVLFAVVAYWMPQMNTGSFVAFNTAFTQFFAATLAVISAMAGSLNVLPLYERSLPILTTRPEIDETKSSPGKLTGAIDISHVSFRYEPEGPLILDDISIRIEPGEFVAFVGPSGSGKSTLFRLLLGFERPENGAIYYDGKNLSDLDVSQVRRQLGVVLQNGQLMFGDVFTNIIGSAPLTLDDAWEAARMAGFEEDIKAMPMGMHTFIAEGAGTISGGQRQRLMIARAIVNKPRILLFDEATSALDNKTQAVVSRSIENLDTTRIVIAHRLSTIIKADRICVIDAGRLVESGNYEELMAKGGHFSELAKRQIA